MSDEQRFRDPRVRINRVYTRTGDRGRTRLVGGQQVAKDDLRIEAYGTVDELMAHIGAAAVSCARLDLHVMVSQLQRVQNALFNLGSLLATLPGDVGPRQPRVGPADVERLEASIDACTAELPPLRSFVLPGGCRANTDLHLARTVCRRAERLCVRLARREPLDPWIVPYLNRLSDALFVWSRWVTAQSGSREVLWDPNEA